MPELPEVETVRRGLAPVLEGNRIDEVEVSNGQLRYPLPEDFARRLAGRTVVHLGRRSKYLLAELDDGNCWLSHLGMTGSFRFSGEDASGTFYLPRGKNAAHDHVRLRMGDGRDVVYNDPRRFGFMDLFAMSDAPTHPRLAGLGPEPLSNDFSAAALASAFAGRTTPLKAALLDQATVAGLGNIYVCEALWRAGLSPFMAAGDLVAPDGTHRLERLVTAVRDVLGEAIAAGGSSLRDYVHADGSLGYFQHAFSVYDREGEPCRRPGCGGTVVRRRQSGRSTFFCEICQR